MFQQAIFPEHSHQGPGEEPTIEVILHKERLQGTVEQYCGR
jgi:hypothetical protein